MARHYDFQRYGNSRVGIIDPGVVVNVATSVIDFATQLFGKDAVPDYPIKSGNTYASLKSSIIQWVGVVAPKGKFEPGPPSSVDAAKIMLAKAIKRKDEETALGHGYGDGVGWDTLQMLYEETIASLQAFIQQGGLSLTAAATTLPANGYPTTTAPGTGTGIFSNPLILAGAAAAAIYLLTRKKSHR